MSMDHGGEKPDKQTIPFLGNPEAQAGFVAANETLCGWLVDIKHACDAADFKGKMSRDDIVIYSFVRLTIEDFQEVILLCANGSTTGAMKILRGMFERTVTVWYLSEHPNEIESFVAYWPVSQRRAANRVAQDLPGALPQSLLDSIEAKYKAVKDQFQMPNCEKCGTTRINHNWSRKDIISMAKGGEFEVVIQAGYYAPLSETHPTMGAILRRVNYEPEGNSFEYVYGHKPLYQETTLISAYYLLFKALETFNRRFKREGLGPLLERCLADWKEWLEEIKKTDH